MDFRHSVSCRPDCVVNSPLGGRYWTFNLLVACIVRPFVCRGSCTCLSCPRLRLVIDWMPLHRPAGSATHPPDWTLVFSTRMSLSLQVMSDWLGNCFNSDGPGSRKICNSL